MNNGQKERSVIRFTIIIGFLMYVLCSGCSGSSNSGEGYSVSGTISGLKSGETLVLKNHLGEELTLSANGEFRFQGKIPNNSSYSHTIIRQPSCQACSVEKGSGTINGGDITDVTVTCGYSVGGMVYGLAPGGSLDFNINSHPSSMNINSNGPFTYPITQPDGTAYTIYYANLSNNQACTFFPGTTGTISGSNVNNITIRFNSQLNRFAYTANAGSNTISICSAPPGYGPVQQVGTVATGNYPVSVAVDPSNRFVYAANEHDPSISAYSIDQASGLLTAVPGSPFAVESSAVSPYCVTIDPFSRFVYVVNTTSNNISAFTINSSTGALTLVPGGPFATGGNPNSIIVDPRGKFVYTANNADSGATGGNTISAFLINQSTGALTPVSGGPYAAVGPQSVAIDPLGKFLYIANQNNNTIGAYSIDPATGALTGVPGQGFPSGEKPISVAVHPTANFVYAANFGEGAGNKYYIYAYSYSSSGVLTQISGSPIVTGTRPFSIAIDPTGSMLHVSCQQGGVYTYFIDEATGALDPAPSNPCQVGSSAMSVASAMAGRFTCYILDNFARNLEAFSLNISTGAISKIQSVSGDFTLMLDANLKVDPTGRFLHLSGLNTHVFSIEAPTGILTEITGSPFMAALNGYIAMHPTGRFSYVIPEAISSGVIGYMIDPVAGALTGMTGTLPSMNTPKGAVFSPSGAFAYIVTNETLNFSNVYAYSVDPITGVLTANVPGSPFIDAFAPDSISIDPLGRFLYLTKSGSGKIEGYALNQTTGALTKISGSPFTANGESHMTIHSSGRFAYAVSVHQFTSGYVTGYSIDDQTGVLTEISGSHLPADMNPVSISVDPTGKYLCVVNDSSISVYLINPWTGALNEVIGSPFALGSTSIAASGFNYTVR